MDNNELEFKDLNLKKDAGSVKTLGEFEDDLDSEYADELIAEKAMTDEIELTQDLDGFASCFPDWDLHPPKKQK